MYQDNLFCLDLAKKTIQGCLLDKNHQVRFNRTFSRKKLIEWLSRQQPMTVAMEACSTSHYWSRVFERLVIACYRLVQMSLPDQRCPLVLVRIHVVRFQLQCPVKGGNRLPQFSLQSKCITQIVECDGKVGLNLKGPAIRSSSAEWTTPAT